MDEKHSERSADLARLERQLQNLQRQRKVDALEAGPGRRWNGLTEKAAWAVCAAVIAFLLGGIGL